MGGGVVLSVVMFGALAIALQSPTYDDGQASELYNVTHKPMPDGLDQLPKSYAELKPKLGPPLPGDLGAAYIAERLPEVKKRGSGSRAVRRVPAHFAIASLPLSGHGGDIDPCQSGHGA